MKNQEIDIRLKKLSEEIPRVIQSRPPGVEREVEGINMSLMAVWTMLGEIAKRLPESDNNEGGFSIPNRKSLESASTVLHQKSKEMAVLNDYAGASTLTSVALWLEKLA